MTVKDVNSQEYNPHYSQYLDQIPKDEPLIPLMERLKNDFVELIDSLETEILKYRYAQEKWTVAQVLQHMIDTERIFQFRALTFARKDTTILAGYDQDNYVTVSQAEERTTSDVKKEFLAVRNAGIELFKSFNEEMLKGSGTASNSLLSARAAAFIICGHQIHHQELFKSLYGL